MRKIRRTVSLILAAAALCLLLCACGGSKAGVPVADIAAKVSEAIGKTDSLVAVDSSFIKGYMKTDVTQFGDYTLQVNAYGANIDEFGIFKAGESMKAADIKAVVEAYLQLKLDTWMDEYMPEEKPKLTSAQVKVNGDYVMYCILSDEDSKAAFAAFEDCLK